MFLNRATWAGQKLFTSVVLTSQSWNLIFIRLELMCLMEEMSRTAGALQCPDIPGMEIFSHIWLKVLETFPAWKRSEDPPHKQIRLGRGKNGPQKCDLDTRLMARIGCHSGAQNNLSVENLSPLLEEVKNINLLEYMLTFNPVRFIYTSGDWTLNTTPVVSNSWVDHFILISLNMENWSEKSRSSAYNCMTYFVRKKTQISPLSELTSALVWKNTGKQGKMFSRSHQ